MRDKRAGRRNDILMDDIVEVVVYGSFACFTRSEAKIDRVSYDIPTPSACRGMLEAIYCKPKEFWYEITGIDILRPVRHVNIMKNEVKRKISPSKPEPLDTDDERTQRNTVYLADVAYKITAKIHVRETGSGIPVYDGLRKQKEEFKRRVRKGKCAWQPYLGTRECLAFFREPDAEDVPINETVDFGTVLYDIFDPENMIPLDTGPKARETCRVTVTYYNPVMKNGHIEVPPKNQVLRLPGKTEDINP